MRRRGIAASLALLLLGVAGALAAGWIKVPPPYDPFAPLDVAAPPNAVTWLKLLRLEHDAKACFQALDSSGLDYARLPDQPSARGCPLIDTVRVEGSTTEFNRPFVATCPLAVSLALLERHAIQPAAQRRFGQSVRRIEHVGSYACRNVYGRERGRRSQHASANAIDVTAFVLENGTRIGVQRGWSGGADAAAFLREVRDGACRFFNAVLSPDYNAAHHDHFHLDMGGFRTCR